MKVGVVVGRFQIDRLHQGHRELLAVSAEKCDILCVVIGNNENLGSRRNPLDFITRKILIEAWAKEVNLRVPLVVLSQQDKPSDWTWSKNLDAVLRQTFPRFEITLYGGRDSFLKHYQGTLPSVDLSKEVNLSWLNATSRREDIAHTPGFSDDFRTGVIYGAYNQWPRLFMCVDIAVQGPDGDIWVGRRNSEEYCRFFGGFVDQKDNSLEEAARRELEEEAGENLHVQSMEYLGSYKVTDYRYSSPNDGLVMTALFLAKTNLTPVAGDDIDSVCSFDIQKLDLPYIVNSMVDSHKPLMRTVLVYLEGKKNE